jgi:hypothetical protein
MCRELAISSTSQIHVEIHLKRYTLAVVALAFCFAISGCSDDLNKNVPKSLPPGAKPFQTNDKAPGGQGQAKESR